jgi:uncharacterized coiled-coil protein SlyX
MYLEMTTISIPYDPVIGQWLNYNEIKRRYEELVSEHEILKGRYREILDRTEVGTVGNFREINHSEFKKNLDQLYEKNVEQLKRISELETKNDEQSKLITELKEQILKQSKIIAELKDQILKQSKIIAELKDQILKQSKIIAELKDQITELKEKNDEQSNRIHTQDDKISRLEVEIIDMKNEIIDMKNNKLYKRLITAIQDVSKKFKLKGTFQYLSDLGDERIRNNHFMVLERDETVNERKQPQYLSELLKVLLHIPEPVGNRLRKNYGSIVPDMIGFLREKNVSEDVELSDFWDGFRI